MKTGYIYISSNGAKEDNNAFILSELQKLLTLAYKTGIVIRQVFIDFNQSGISAPKPQLSKLMEAMMANKSRYVLVTEISRISRNIGYLRTFFSCAYVTDTKIVALSEQKKKKGRK